MVTFDLILLQFSADIVCDFIMFEYEVVNKETTPLFNILDKGFTSILQPKYILAGKEKICMPEHFKDIADEIENFDVFEDDIFLISYPKTGAWVS